MPIEIRELNIKVSVSQSPAAQNDQSGGRGSGQGGSAVDKDQVIAECVEQVMEILKIKSER